MPWFGGLSEPGIRCFSVLCVDELRVDESIVDCKSLQWCAASIIIYNENKNYAATESMIHNFLENL